MIISLDYDLCYDRDIEMWGKFIAIARAAGHEIICVSMRSNPEKIPFPGKVVCTAGIAKVKFCKEHNINVDIWIDDMPYRLINDALGW